MDLVTTQAMQFVQGQILKQTILASLLTALSPVAWLKITKVIGELPSMHISPRSDSHPFLDNPWMTAQSLAVKAGKVLGTLLAERVLGARPVTLVGYSLGSLVIFEALRHLAALPPAQTLGLVHDVFLFGSPVPADAAAWAAARRVAAGRVVNGYGRDDYVLAVLARVSGANWRVAGLSPVDVPGVEDVACEGVDGHLKWRGLVGQALAQCGAPGLDLAQVRAQVDTKAARISEAVDMSEEEATRAVEAGPGGDVERTAPRERASPAMHPDIPPWVYK